MSLPKPEWFAQRAEEVYAWGIDTRDLYAKIFPMAYEAVRGGGRERVAGGETHSDPTFAAFLGSEHVRDACWKALKHMEAASNELRAAHKTLSQLTGAGPRVDGMRDDLAGEGIRVREMAELVAAQGRRRERGEE